MALPRVGLIFFYFFSVIISASYWRSVGRTHRSLTWLVYSNVAPVPGMIISDYKVSIQSTSQPEIKDVSNNYFTISSGTPAPTIIVKSPNGGEIWKRGTTHSITWDSKGIPASNVKIELLKGSVVNKVITPSTSIGRSNPGTYSWQIPATQILGTDYKIRVTTVDNPSTSRSNSVYSDTSNANFTIN